METIAFSVIVPTFNRLPSLRNTLDSLFRQDYSPVEIIVVDDGSTDATPLYLAELASAGAIRHIRQENRGPAAARNAGAAIARGTIIGFTDDDCTLPADWVSDYVRTFASCDAALVGGIALNRIPGDFFSAFSQEITNYYVHTMASPDGSTVFLTSNNMAIRASAFSGSGGFDERFSRAGGEERALFFRVLSMGGKCILDERIAVNHHHRLFAGTFLRQQHNYGRGAYLLHGSTDSGRGVQPVPIPLRIYRGLLRSFFGRGFASGCLRSFWFALAQLSASAGYLRQSLEQRRREVNR